MDTIRVTSHLEKTLKGRYDGKDYVFEPGEAVILSLNAAQHIFGLGQEDKSDALNRLELLIPYKSTMAEALAALDKITFDVGRVTFDPDDVPDDEDDDDAAPARSARKAAGGRRPHVDPSGDTGASKGAPANPD
jgi:hypothetical protein